MIGYLRFTENCGFRIPGLERRWASLEFSVGDEVEIYDLNHHRIEQYIASNCVKVLDPLKKETTIEALREAEPKPPPVQVFTSESIRKRTTKPRKKKYGRK